MEPGERVKTAVSIAARAHSFDKISTARRDLDRNVPEPHFDSTPAVVVERFVRNDHLFGLESGLRIPCKMPAISVL